MADDTKPDANSPSPPPLTTSSQDRPKAVEAKTPAAHPLPPPILDALEKIPDTEAKALMQFALSKTTLGFGPDPDTARTIAQAEMHEEECKLKAFQCSMQNREQQNVRDHEFRKKKLNHQTGLTLMILLVTIGGVGGGLVLSATGNSSLGNPVLTASFTMLCALGGKLLSSRDKD